MKSKALVLVFLMYLLSIPVMCAEDSVDWYVKGQQALNAWNYAAATTYYDNAHALDRNYATPSKVRQDAERSRTIY